VIVQLEYPRLGDAAPGEQQELPSELCSALGRGPELAQIAARVVVRGALD